MRKSYPGFNITDEKNNNGYTISTNKKTFRILQITDLHYWFYVRNSKITKIIRDLCNQYDVDFVVNTGDFWCGGVPYFLIKRMCRKFDKKLNRPWAFAWGNHDNECYVRDNWMKHYDRIERLLEGLPNCFYKKSRKFIENINPNNIQNSEIEREVCLPFISGSLDSINSKKIKKRFDGFYGGNYKIQIKYQDLNENKLDVFILNSRWNHHIPPNALEWMEKEINQNNPKIPAIVFYHIPDYAYKTILENNSARGICREGVSAQEERGRIHDFFIKMGNINATFVGHDHVNDYHAVLDGIDVVFGRKSSYRAYGGINRKKDNIPIREDEKAIEWGAKLISINLEQKTNGKKLIEHQTIIYDGERWDYPDKLIEIKPN